MTDSIQLHREHGLNPTIPVCWFCGKDKNEIALLGAAHKTQAPMHMVVDRRPCDDCLELMKQGIWCLEVVPGTKGNPQRAQSSCLITDEAASRIFVDTDLSMRVVLVPTDVWDMIGLPRENIDNRKVDHGTQTETAVPVL